MVGARLTWAKNKSRLSRNKDLKKEFKQARNPVLSNNKKSKARLLIQAFIKKLSLFKSGYR